MTTLSLKARGSALVSDYEAMEHGVRRYIGRRAVTQPSGQVAWVPVDEPENKSALAEYIDAVRRGELEAADEMTARLSGVEFHAEVKE